MSLFIGNLSARTRADDLHRLFRKFGHCTINRKHHYGFVVYDSPQDAEKALRALQGRYICGEPLVLTWSKKQPIPFQGHQRVVRSSELQGSYPARRREFAGKRMSSNDRRDYRYLPDDGHTDVAELGDTANNTDHELEFDRYVPCRSDEEKVEHEKRQRGDSAPQRSRENARIIKTGDTTLNHHDDLKSRNACFSCGDLGHKIRDCPRKYSSRRRPTGFDHRQDDAVGKSSRGEAELDRFGSMSRKHLRLKKDTVSGHRKSEWASASGKSEMLIKNGTSPVIVGKETDRTKMDHGRKKRSRWEDKSPKWNSATKRARTVSSQPHSDYHASKSSAISQSSKSVSRCSSSRGRSKSVSMRRQSLSSDTGSSSKSISSKSTSMSRSSSFTSSSESLSRSSYKAHVDLKSNAKEILLEKRLPIGGSVLTVQNPGSNGAWCSSPEVSKEKINPENSSGVVVGAAQVKEPASEMHVNYCNGRSTCISSEEMCMVLKHYGMELPEESERHLPIEECFGSARLWPWEIIYYRRLKKGLVSVENYARRVSQNQEFGIVDKYVRSSSGWGEIDQDNS